MQGSMKKIIAGTALLILPMTAMAATQGPTSPWYGGATIGIASLSGFSSPVDFTIFGGYRLPVHLSRGKLAVELGYDHMGTFKMNNLPAGESVSLSAHAVEASAVYAWPITSAFRVYGRAGLAFWNASATANVSGYTVSAAGSGTDPLLGVGVSYSVMPHLSVRGEYRVITSSNISIFDVGGVYSF